MVEFVEIEEEDKVLVVVWRSLCCDVGRVGDKVVVKAWL